MKPSPSIQPALSTEVFTYKLFYINKKVHGKAPVRLFLELNYNVRK
jgi:hypothetical protein